MRSSALCKHLLSGQLVLLDVFSDPLPPLFPVLLTFLPDPVLFTGNAFHTRPHSRGGDEFRVGENGGTTKRAFKDFDGSKDESRADFDKGGLRRAGRSERVFLNYLNDDIRTVSMG